MLKIGTLCIMLSVLALPVHSFAVTVDQCPEKIKIALNQIHSLSADKIKSEFAPHDPEIATAIKASSIVQNLGTFNRTMQIDKANTGNGVCWYVDGSNTFVRFYTKGTDKLRIRFFLPELKVVVTTYAQVANYSPAGFKISNNSAWINLSEGVPTENGVATSDIAAIATASIAVK